ncbi:MAG: M50 family metallopeptidase [Archangium sp.]
MLRFRFASVPVHLHITHLAVCAFVGSIFFTATKVKGTWPRVELAEVAHPQHTSTLIVVTLVWALLVSLSLVVHEVGHAVFMRTFGAQPHVHLLGLGGRTLLEKPVQFEWWQELIIALAGPGASLALGVFAGLIALLPNAPEPLVYFATGLAKGNLWWAAINLLPIPGLDGATLSSVFLTRVLGRPGYLVAQLLSLALAGFFLLITLAGGQWVGAVLVGLIVMRTLMNIAAFRRGEAEAGQRHPLQDVMERAEGLYRDRKLTEAQFIAHGVVEAAETPPLLRSRAHVLLGWIALKEGQGRRALDHFSQVQGLEVPPHALAAGFSLIGDETRAIPLWALAQQRAPNDDVIKHEWAGALVRGGFEATARAIAGVDMVRAFSAAERVHYVRKEFEQGAKAAEAAFHERPHATLAYTAACAWAQAGKLDDAMRLLTLAAQNGFQDAKEAEGDPDLRPLRTRPEFMAWLAGLKAPQSPAS